MNDNKIWHIILASTLIKRFWQSVATYFCYRLYNYLFYMQLARLAYIFVNLPFSTREAHLKSTKLHQKYKFVSLYSLNFIFYFVALFLAYISKIKLLLLTNITSISQSSTKSCYWMWFHLSPYNTLCLHFVVTIVIRL